MAKGKFRNCDAYYEASQKPNRTTQKMNGLRGDESHNIFSVQNKRQYSLCYTVFYAKDYLNGAKIRKESVKVV